MKKYLPFLLLGTLIIILGGLRFFSKEKPTEDSLPLPTSFEYFWGDGCPHCTVVEEFYSTWEERDKLNINKMEVWANPEYAKVLQQRAEYCGIRPSEIGVPFLFTPDGKCLSGDEPIIDYFKNLDI